MMMMMMYRLATMNGVTDRRKDRQQTDGNYHGDSPS